MKRYLVLLLVVTLIASSALLLVGCNSEDSSFDYGKLHDTYESTLELEDYEDEVILQYNVVSGTTEFVFDDAIIELDDSYMFTVADLEGTEYDDKTVTLSSGDNIFVLDIYFYTVEYSTEEDSEGNTETTETVTTDYVDTLIINVHVLEMVTVTFYHGDDVFHTVDIMEDSLLTPPETDPTEDDNEFVAWVDEDGHEIDFATYKVFGNTDIFASWTENVVTFDLDGGTMSSDTTIIVSNYYVLGDIEEPTRDGWVFSGWCDDDGVYFDVTTEIIFSDVTLVAQWSQFKWDFEILLDDTVELTYAGDNSGSVVVPTTYNGFVVSALADNAFKGFDGITVVTIPEGIIEIGTMAFMNCTALTTIEVPATVTEIGRYAFYGCTSLVDVTLNEGLTSIGMFAFNGCTSIETLTVPSTVTVIENYAFKYCDTLIVFSSVSAEPSTWASAWDAYGPIAVYYDMGNTSSLVLVDDAYYVVTVGTETTTATLIKYVGSSTEFVVPVSLQLEVDEVMQEISVVAIGEVAFAGNTTLTSVTLPYEILKIGARAFEDCTGMTINVCERSKEAYNWDEDWNISGCTVVWESTYPSDD